MKLIYKGALNRTDLELIRLGILKVGESFQRGKVYDLPNDYAEAVLETPNWEKAPIIQKKKEYKKKGDK